ncbi:MAG: glycosyltransferase family 2 protein [Bacteroidota bacterium]|nr:glycosyltransferase family 2 protein [Bacteroidota bacterium]
MKLIITLRVKNAMLFIEEWLNCYEKLADGIVVVDNGSDDGTYEKLMLSPKVLEIKRTEGFDEGRDNKILLNLLEKYKPDWILTVDADEIFEKRVNRSDLNRLMNRKWVSHYRFVLFNLFKDQNHYLADNFMLNAMMRGYGRSLYRYSSDLNVKDDFIHVGITGKDNFFLPSNLRLMHLCFLHKEYRMKVYENYLKVDGENETHVKWYKRDISILENPNLVRTLKFNNKPIYIFRDFLLFNILYPFKLLKSIIP